MHGKKQAVKGYTDLGIQCGVYSSFWRIRTPSNDTTPGAQVMKIYSLCSWATGQARVYAVGISILSKEFFERIIIGFDEKS